MDSKTTSGSALVFLMMGVIWLLTLDSTVIGAVFLVIGIGFLVAGWASRRGTAPEPDDDAEPPAGGVNGPRA